MYVYDEYDQRIIEDRVKQFRDQTRRYLAGELSEEEFRCACRTACTSSASRRCCASRCPTAN
jgi:sulfite reductase beta subunit-like hemoprotein